MIRVGWLADEAEHLGGAELTTMAFRAATPPGVTVVDCPPGEVDDTCDLFAIHNCMTYTAADIATATARPAVKYWNDVGPWLEPEVRSLLDTARPVCCSPLQAEYMGLEDATLVAPPIDLNWFETAGSRVNGQRSGVVSVGSWFNIGKAPQRVAEWAARERVEVDFYGGGPFAPRSSQEIAYESMAALLAQYRTFVFLPTALEPFGRTVVEAWAAGLELVVNDLVGAKWWIVENPERLYTAADDFWATLTMAVR